VLVWRLRIARVVGDWLALRLGLGSASSLGRVLEAWTSIDAFVVLSGAVLTAYVGIDGLLYQV
jgi:hypothetical protein